MNIKEINEIIAGLEKIVYSKNKTISKKDTDIILKAQATIMNANKSYYIDSEEIMSDFMYDRLKKLVLQVEEAHKELKSSVGDTIGAGVVLGTKVKHIVPMLSLSNTYNIEELKDWIDKSGVTPDDIVIQSKLDGCSISLTYKNGKLVQALSRGDGETGEDVTQNVMQIKSIPKEISLKDDITIRGEILMSYKSFLDNNKTLGEKPFANPRNAASGTLRQKDPKVVAKRNLDGMMYQIVNPNKFNLNSEKDVISMLGKLGFRTPYMFTAKLEEYEDFLYNRDTSKDSKDFPCDGLVFKINSFADQFRLGVTTKAPRYAVAYKFPPEEATSKLRRVEFQVGRTGRITPVADFYPVVIDGTVVTHATLHNIDYLLETRFKIGDEITVVKAAEIIPKITGYNKKYREKALKENSLFDIDIPSKCPCCGEPLKKSGKDLMCENTECFDRKLEEFKYFVSRDGCNINGIGPAILRDCMNEGLIKSFIDIFKLKNKSHILLTWDGYSDKTVENIIKSIDESIKNISYVDLLGSIGINLIGNTAAKKLVSEIDSFDELMTLIKNKSFDRIHKALGGVVAGESLISYFENEDNVKMMREFEELGINLSKKKSNSKLAGMKVCVTGNLVDIKRDELARKLDDEYGIMVVSSVGPTVSYLVIGDKPTEHKVEKAKDLGIKIVNYTTLLTELQKENMTQI